MRDHSIAINVIQCILGGPFGTACGMGSKQASNSITSGPTCFSDVSVSRRQLSLNQSNVYGILLAMCMVSGDNQCPMYWGLDTINARVYGSLVTINARVY